MLRHFAWVGGHADVWAVFRDADALRTVIGALAEPFRGGAVTAVCGVESRGFLLGGAVAVALGLGFVPVRKSDGLFPGDKATCAAAPDYRGLTHTLRVQRSALRPGDRLLLVDDWVETGSQALAVGRLAEECGAELVACSVIVNQLGGPPPAGRLHAILTADELPG